MPGHHYLPMILKMLIIKNNKLSNNLFPEKVLCLKGHRNVNLQPVLHYI